jgi:hypothetical protein
MDRQRIDKVLVTAKAPKKEKSSEEEDDDSETPAED